MKKTEKAVETFMYGDRIPHPLDIGTFKYECLNVLGLTEMSDAELYELSHYLIIHYYTLSKKNRENLRYSVVEA
jgi:hypothetical protein